MALTGDALPSTAPSVSAFNVREVNLYAYGADMMAPPSYTVTANVTSITALPAVPEPGTVALFLTGLGGLLAFVDRRRAEPPLA